MFVPIPVSKSPFTSRLTAVELGLDDVVEEDVELLVGVEICVVDVDRLSATDDVCVVLAEESLVDALLVVVMIMVSDWKSTVVVLVTYTVAV